MTNNTLPLIFRDKIFDHMWLKERFTKCQAIIDLMYSAETDDKIVQYKNDIYALKQGTFITTFDDLSKRWQWSKSTVYKFIKLLEKQELLTYETSKRGTVITITDYAEIAWSFYKAREAEEYTNKVTDIANSKGIELNTDYIEE